MDIDKLIVSEPNTDLVSTAKVNSYVEGVKQHLPEGLEDQFFWAGVSDMVNGYVYFCFMTDVDPKECAETIVEKIGA